MKTLNVRSPYFIEVDEDGQLAAKVDLYIWHKGETEPAQPTYTLQKNIVSPTQTNIVFNISPFVAEFVENINAEQRTSPNEESNDVWVYVRAEWFYTDEPELKDWIAVRELSLVGVNGFTSYLGGYNQTNDNPVVYLIDPTITQYYNEASTQLQLPYFNVLIQHDGSSLTEVKWTNRRTLSSSTQTLLDDSMPADIYMFLIPAKNNEITNHDFGNDITIETELMETVLPTITYLPVCEPKYTPVVCEYVNRFGGWQFLTFWKAQTNNLSVDSSTFHLLPDAVDYNPLRNQFQSFNFKGKQSVTLNTGWVAENYANLITDLMLSETVLLDDKPVNVKSKSTELKTQLKNKNINYTIEFEYSYNLINDVI